jgi:excisionase family DNA binding protein
VSQLSTGLGEDELGGALVVRPARAAAILNSSRKRVYEMIAAGELKSFRDGGARKITVESIRGYIARKLAESPKQAA